jgi:hypothetical protein
MRRPLILALALAFAASFAGCAITHSFGPYFGKVVDAETGEPLEGAVVLIDFNTKEYTLGGGPRSSFVDAVEVLTDEKGEFKIPAFRPWVFRFPHQWDPYGEMTVFKPGYGAYPRSKSVDPVFIPTYSIPCNEHSIIKLPKLHSHEDRRLNLGEIIPGGVPKEKMKTLIDLIHIERKELGLKQ